jgi:DNA-binding CsgD family transcriptional regulator
MKSHSTGDPETHRFALQFRFKNKQEEYKHLRFEHLAIKISANRYLYLILYRDITQEEKFYHVKLDVFKSIHGSYMKMNTYNPIQPERDITPRQNDIAKLVTKGFSNQEIADQLGVSIYTIKNHKQMLFRKVNVRSSVELANYVKSIGN